MEELLKNKDDPSEPQGDAVPDCPSTEDGDPVQMPESPELETEMGDLANQEKVPSPETVPESQNFMDCGDDGDQTEQEQKTDNREGKAGMVACDICTDTFRSGDLQRHIDKCHKEPKPKGATTYQCELCGYATNRTTNYNMHYKMVHLKSRTMCELCGKEYSNINQHMRVVHKSLKSGMTEKKSCDQCGNKYYGKKW